jgi:predicted O-methyltransferase YrrM
VNAVLKEILDRGLVADAQGKERDVRDHVGPLCGKLIQDSIVKPNARVLVEVGCAYGISSLSIGEALRSSPGSRHIILDPLQNDPEYYNGIGLRNLSQAGYLDTVDFREVPSEVGLPQLLVEGVKADLICLDGYHTFDHTLVDFFYGNRLLKVSGMIIFDDVQMPSVRKVVRMAASYGCYRISGVVPAVPTTSRRLVTILKKGLRPVSGCLGRVGRELFHPEISGVREMLGLHATVVALTKTREDDRMWNWFSDF